MRDDYYSEGLKRYREGDFVEAVRLLRHAHAQNPRDASLLSNLGSALQECGAIDEAIYRFSQAVQERPYFPNAYFNLGNALSKKKAFHEALAAFNEAIWQNPSFCDAYVHRGLVLEALEQNVSALLSYESALESDSSHVNALVNRGNILAALGSDAEAALSYQRAVNVDPANAVAHYNYGKLLYEQGKFIQALDSFDRAIANRADYPSAYASKAVVLLQLGMFGQGWELYEWRWRAGTGLNTRPNRNAPLWRGDTDLRGLTILLHAEQGLGDTIQFCRYVPMVKALGAHVVLEVQKPLIGLMQVLDGVDELLIAGTSTPKYDYHCPLLSLPLAFKTTPDSIPNRVPYLKAERARVARWRTHLTESDFKIAINWQGNHKNPLDKGRSFPLTMFREISKIEGVRLISLQKKNGLEQLRSSQSVVTVEELPTDFDQEGNEFLDSAAVMHCVDLVISSDTSIAHLAGSLGVETWVPLKFVPDWRWMTADMKKNAWYPTVQLYRQSNAGDWEKPFREITSAIYDRVQANDM